MDRRSNQTNDLATPRTASISSTTTSVEPRRGSRLPTDVGVGPENQAGRTGMAAWLTAGRTARGLTREHVARVTRIQLRTIERLEEGRFDELPADVFVRGFIRNYALCVGLSVDDALARYAACGFAAAPVASAQAQALLDTMASLAPASGGRTSSVTVVPSAPRMLRVSEQIPVVVPPAEVVAPAPVVVAAAAAAMVETAPASPTRRAKTKAERDAKGRFVRKGTLSQQQAAVDLEALGLTDDAAAAGFASGFASEVDDEDLEVEITVVDAAAISLAPADELVESKLAAPPPAVHSPITERFVVTVRPTPVSATPTLTIDDDDPESAEREREERATRARDKDKDGGWRSFLPPALLDQDRGRQGGLTLAVIILLIVATLTLSYLMRRPSSTGEGVTSIPAAAHVDRAV
jgi:hypothetical protein